ncbi:MAG: thioesterase [Ruthenibacterium sp.]
MATQTYQDFFTVTDNECDTENRMTLSAILRRVQQIATDQCSARGLTAAVYARTHTAFLLAKAVAEVFVDIPRGTKITLTTQPSSAQRAVYYRYTTFRGDDGTLLAAVDSRWILIDTDTKRILRQSPAEVKQCFDGPPAADLDVTVHKAAAEPVFVSQQTATYTRCDGNRHINNTVYADIVTDAMPLESMLTHSPSRFAISYHHEVPMGESFSLLRAKTENDSWYFIGKTDETKCFEAEMTLR